LSFIPLPFKFFVTKYAASNAYPETLHLVEQRLLPENILVDVDHFDTSLKTRFSMLVVTSSVTSKSFINL